MMHVVICVSPASEEGASLEGEHALGTADCGEVDDPLGLHLQLSLACLSLSPFRVPAITVVNMDIWPWIVRRKREIWPLVIISRTKLMMAVECREDEDSLLDGVEFKR